MTLNFEQFLSFIPNTPLVSFTILILVVLLIPPIFERIKLPGLVGLLVSGVVLGTNGLGLLNPEDDTITLLSDIGKIYLMFVAGLEIDLKEFRKKKNRAIGFGVATFLLPLISGILVGRFVGFQWNTAILMGSLLSSHTLLGYPIVNRLGVVRNEAVVVTIGATIFTDITALLVLAICVSVHQGNFTPASLVLQLASLAIYSLMVLFGFERLGKEYFKRTGNEQSNQFLFVLGAVFLASLGAQLINVDKIVGAFLAGLAVNDVVGRGPVKEKVEFVGSTLFIPFFFVGMGLLLNVETFIESLTLEIGLTLGLLVGLILAKLLASFLAKLVYRYNWAEMLTMWSLSLPQVAATLAAALAGYQAINGAEERLLNESVFNAVIVLMLITSLLGPILTSQFGSRIAPPKADFAVKSEDWTLGLEWENPAQVVPKGDRFRVVVPVYNPLTQKYLVEMATLLARHELGVVVPLSITPASVHMDEPKLQIAFNRSERLIDHAIEITQAFQVEADPQIRIDDDIAYGISRVAREQKANLIVMGWSEKLGLRAKLFGNVIDQVFWSSHCPVAVLRLMDELIDIHSILVPIKTITPVMVQTIRFAQFFADSNDAKVTLLHVSDRRTDQDQIQQFEEQLRDIVTKMDLSVQTDVRTIIHEDATKVIIKAALAFDMVILRSTRYRTSGGLAVSNITTELMKELTCSLVLFGEPHS